MSHGHLASLELADEAHDLEAVGFASPFQIGNTRLVAVGSGEGIVGATIAGVDELDGLPLRDVAPDPQSGTEHPNGVMAIDHVVVMTPNPDRTQAAFEAAGLEARRVRTIDGGRGRARRQTFHWLGDVIREVVGPDDGDGDGPAAFWGIALTVDDLDATHRRLQPQVSDIKAAVQQGRSVCTLKAPDVTTPILFISSHARSGGTDER